MKPSHTSVQKSRYLGLRGKLVVTSLILLLLPIAGYFYLVELETYLKNSQMSHQLENSRLMAEFFNSDKNLEQSNQKHNGQQSLYIYSLKRQPLVDGYFNDWMPMALPEQAFFDPASAQKTKFTVVAGRYHEKVYFFIKVFDASKRYKLPIYQQQYDHIQLSLKTSVSQATAPFKLEQILVFDFATEAPGWIKANSLFLNPIPEIKPVQKINRDEEIKQPVSIKGEWQETQDGYQLEFSFPSELLSDYMAISVFDNGVPVSTIDAPLPSQIITSQIITSHIRFNPVIQESPELNQRLQQLQQKLSDQHSRLYIINQQAEVLAQIGRFERTSLSFRQPNSFITHLNNLYYSLSGLEIKNRRYLAEQVVLDGDEIQNALGRNRPSARPSATWLAGSSSQTLILSTAAPIRDIQGKVMGALVMERTNAAILTLQDQLFEKMLIASFVLFLSIAMVLILYAGRLVNRILNLQKATELALTQEGKFNPVFPSSNSRDEIGQLSRSFTTLMQQLDQYTGYLESLASKLSHELRTPLSIIRSSLENMQFQGISQNNQQFMQRAMEGCQRLSLILSRMGEASRLEQSIQSSEQQKIDLNMFLDRYVKAIQVANPDVSFQFKPGAQSIEIFAAPDLVAQLLDKLVENAISFHTLQTTITLTLSKKSDKSPIIDIFNVGPWIAPDQSNSIFNSMVSYRSPKATKTKTTKASVTSVNLGLGLHIAKLICEHHDAKLYCKNRIAVRENREGDGVSFLIRFNPSKTLSTSIKSKEITD